MKDLIRKITGHMIIEAIVSIILGIVLLLWPMTTTKTFIYLFAAYFAVLGVMDIISYIRSKDSTGTLLLGILKLIVALVIFAFPGEVGGFIGLIMGIAIVLIGVFNITRSLDLKRVGINTWTLILVLNIIVVIAGIIVIFNPFSTVVTLAQLLGAILIGKGIVDLVSCLTFSKNLKN